MTTEKNTLKKLFPARLLVSVSDTKLYITYIHNNSLYIYRIGLYIVIMINHIL